MKSSIKILFLTLLFATSISAANANERFRNVSNFTTLAPLTTPTKDVIFRIATADTSLNLEKRDTALIRVSRPNNLLIANRNLQNIEVVVYDVTSAGNREFVTSKTISVGSNRKKRIQFPIELGTFTSAARSLEFDLYDSLGNFVATYPVTINAINITSQVAGGNDPNRSVNCTGLTTVECIENYLLNNVSFIADPKKQATASITKDASGRMNFRAAYAREFRDFSGNRRKINVNANNTGGTSSTVLASFGETMDISRIRLGPNQEDFANFRYDNTTGTFILSSGVNGNTLTDNFYFTDSGKLGIGVADPLAFLSVRGGTTTMPAVMLEQGTLTTAPINGALEYDGNELYFTKNGVRAPIGTGATGAQGPQGPAGAAGATGAQGPKGDTGNITNGGIVNGPIVFTNNGSFQYPNGGQDGYVWTSDANGLASWKEPAKNVITPVAVSKEIDIDGVTSIDVTGLNFVPLIDSNLATVDTLMSLTGGVVGQRVTIQLKQNNLMFSINNAGVANSIFWGRGTSTGLRTQVQSEIFTFMYDGFAWFLVDRYIL